MRLSRKHIVFIHDLIIAAMALPLALYVRLEGQMFNHFTSHTLAIMVVAFVAIAAASFRAQNMYTGIWRYASINDLISIFRGVTLLVVVFTIALFLYNRLDSFPRSTPFITWAILLLMLGGPRFVYRFYKDRRQIKKSYAPSSKRIPVLLIGAGDSADLFLRAMDTNPNANYRAVGILGETDNRVGRSIRSVKVMGTLEELGKTIDALTQAGQRPQRVILTKDSFDSKIVSQMFEETQALGIGLSRLPRLDNLREALNDQNFDLKPVALEDLLQRPQTVLDRTAMENFIAGRKVLVTGAGGSIGSELVRQIANFQPSELTIVEASEFALYRIDMELSQSHALLPRFATIGDVRDKDRMEAIFAEHKPDLVFHAAALKHVPLVEANPLEGLRTNAVGSSIIAEMCRKHGVSAMVMVSTDKAVNPTNIMGASKRMAECFCQAMDLCDAGGTDQGATRFVTVRFGNVLGSTGSVVPLFEKQLREGGPLTVTHPDMQRYFMTIREAVELIIAAGAMGTGPQSAQEHQGKIYVLEMGKPVKILDLAKQMIRLAGLRPDIDVKIEFTGLRPGEKLFEEIFHGDEELIETASKGVLLASPRQVELSEIRAAITTLERACLEDDTETALRVMRQLVPEYHVPKP